MLRNFVCVALLSWQLQCSAQTGQIRLIVRGDDMGFSHSGNQALLECYREGIQTSVEVIVPAPWFFEAVHMLKDNPGLDVGIHLALTSEWENPKWRPLSNCESLKDEDGYFYPFIWPTANGPSLMDRPWTIEDVEKEFRAQIEMGLKYIPHLSHLSAHMGCTSMSEAVKQLSRRLAKEYRIDIDTEELKVTRATYQGPHQTAAEKKSSFLKMLDSLQAGNTYLFVDHPGIDSPELRAIYHKGYSQVAQDRQGVTSLWTDPQVIARIRKKKIKLISYASLKDR
jgi:predicted glycoside hydrolase/deacetylase ChbG (UPF0249 family)